MSNRVSIQDNIRNPSISETLLGQSIAPSWLEVSTEASTTLAVEGNSPAAEWNSPDDLRGVHLPQRGAVEGLYDHAVAAPNTNRSQSVSQSISQSAWSGRGSLRPCRRCSQSVSQSVSRSVGRKVESEKVA